MSEQVKPCPHCGAKDGWWSKLAKESMVIYHETGEKVEQRLFETKPKHCIVCDMIITNCITP